MDIQLYLEELSKIIEPRLIEIQSFQFYINNPLIWFIALILLMLLMRNWGLKKSLGFTVITLVLAFVLTYTEKKAIAVFNLDPVFVRIAFSVVFFIITLYYIFIRED